ncbi:MAG TPA: type III PLP-dependent enzyme [Spongiibacteraceae bacterium]|jgi:ornithine decarboxylase|nr:type III PLP-dependent enzyme [Spongiibacteraceae bacterium]HUH37404.1 type III PLP-dependent enzyme [Spongiibacteraceae bacterium]
MENPTFSPERWNTLMAFSEQQPTPHLVVDLQLIEQRYQELRGAFPMAMPYYAVKANPHPEVLKRLHRLGSCFDIASIYELDKLLGLGVEPARISYGNTIKKPRDVAYAYGKGIRLFSSDSEADIRTLAEKAPGSEVCVRILTEGDQTADWPLSRKFGCHVDMAVELLCLADELGLKAAGICFHVGSQQRNIGAWDDAIAKVRVVCDRLASQGITLSIINMGGGLPGTYTGKVHDVQTYGESIQRFLNEDFGDELPRIIIEPGRSLVADAGILASEVVLISRKSRDALERWVFLDIGVFGGLIESLGEAIKYQLVSTRDGETEDVILAGPTCDSMDILYERHKYALPKSLERGDRLYWISTGAYTSSYSSVEFNGFPPLKTYVLE